MKYLKMIMIYLIFILCINLFISILFYYDLISDKTLNNFNNISLIIIIFFISFYIGKKSKLKSILESLIISSIFIVISLFLILILPNKICIKDLYNYIGIFLSSFFAIKLSNKFKLKDKNY